MSAFARRKGLGLGIVAAATVLLAASCSEGGKPDTEGVSGGGGADIDPIAQAGRAPTMAYMGDPTRYFTIHHTPADTVERIAPEEVSKGAAAIAVVVYVIAEMTDRLPR